ncbi:hypothetical protein [Actinoplanes teichomyceticus]|uniref:Integral membrane protein n=1 Tax=Actinoplanes teichomyceticus TaxID=1867 RepID=A0A561VCM4_ACTTI|nr:hypothetical protein [Actinoplanes teichomyceticus]TWG09354.1 hypothetical protein FHX34_10869 [Actinoplanes teichomyceticus]GIF16622.1 hypothetical protein Ate01nite_66540 [Actinoplanes teichomyceticus]
MRAAARLRSRRVRTWPSTAGDRWALGTAVALVAAAVVTGAALGWAGRPVRAPAAPLFGHVWPHAGPGTVPAVLLAVAVVRCGPDLAARLRWRPLLAYAWAASTAWTFALALVDGWRRGVTGRLTTRFEYLSEVPGVTDVPALLRGFAGRILADGPDPWATHVAGHPPGALLVFVGLDRVGLGGGGWAAALCVLAGCSATVTVAVTLRALGDEPAARAALPFLVLFPGAVWVGVSADGLFTGVAAAALALLATGLAGPSRWAAAAGGALLAVCAYLSYGLILLVLPAAAVAAVRLRRVPMLIWAGLGAVPVLATVTGLGFDWWQGYHLVRQRYYQGLASQRPYPYWVWANLAALTLSAGPAAAAILRRAAARAPAARTPAVLLCLGAAAAVAAADLSGLSKAEVERIWLPFAIWLPAAAALLPAPDRRGWLGLQAGAALVVNHLVLTSW